MTSYKHFWLRDEKNNPIGCVASIKVDNSVKWSYSALNPKDKWNWTSALKIAEQRLNGETPYTYKVTIPATHPEKVNVKQTIMTELLACQSERARKAAAKWMTLHLAQPPKGAHTQGEK